MPPRMIERLVALGKKADDYSGATAVASQLEDHRAIAEEFAGLAEGLSALRAQHAAMQQCELVLRELHSGSRSHSGVSKVNESCEAEPDWLLSPEGRSTVRELRQILHNTISSWREIIEEDWANYVTSLRPDIDDAALKALHRVPGLAESVGEVIDCMDELSRLSGQPPQSTEDVEATRALARRIDASWKGLSGDLDVEVLMFIRQAAATGADIESLSESVSNWLKEHDLKDSFCIRIRGSGQPGITRHGGAGLR